MGNDAPPNKLKGDDMDSEVVQQDPDEMSFEDSADQCATYIAKRIHGIYGLEINKSMEKMLSLWIQEHFDGHQI